MRKLILCFFIALFSLEDSQAQEFSFFLKFKDSLQNIDSLELGYDANANDTIDGVFGEINLDSIVFNSSFSVAAINYGNQCGNSNQQPRPTQFLKRQIIKKKCVQNQGISKIIIGIKSNSFPLEISWDSLAFNQYCNEMSFITDWSPVGWFDFTCGNIDLPIQNLREKNNIVLNGTSDFEIINGDTIRNLYIAFADSLFTMGLNKKPQEEIHIYPNPTNSFINTEINKNRILKIELFDIKGDLLLKTVNPDLDLSVFPNGIYFINITGNGFVHREKLVKN